MVARGVTALDGARALSHDSAMSVGTLAFVGRSAELEELRAGVAGALAGRGGLWLIAGEPGIGKSRLAEELVRAAGDGVTPLWGRCSEAGGAPAYWPWIQILRALFRHRDAAPLADARAAQLVQLVPELREGRALAEPPPLEPAQARFALMDAVVGALCDAAARAPLLLVLEDLHVADASSLAMLEFLQHQVRGANIAALGTFRDAEAETREPLLRVAREARVLPLRRLGRDEVTRYLATALGRVPEPELAAAVHERTEGHPLFVVELARLLVSRGDIASRSIPTTIRSAIRDRLAGLSAAGRETLELAAVLGREFRVADLADAFDRDPLELADALTEACRAAILIEAGAARYRFSHILVRGHIYDELAPERRVELHTRAANALRVADAPASTVAHHLLAASDPRAVDACVEAADTAATQLAIDDAVGWYRRALQALATIDAPSARVAGVRLRMAEAQLRAGQVDAGRDECRAVAAIARGLGDAELLARAALTYGAVFVFATVDATLISLLEEARDALPQGDSDLRARVLARLAAALQPAPDPNGPIELAREAIAMARRCGDAHTRLATLRAGCSTMVDLGDPRERVDLDREHAQLADQLGDPVEAMRGNTRLAMDCFELADIAGANAAIERVTRLGEQLGRPYYQWRAAAFATTQALWDGRLDDAARALARATELHARGGDINAARTLPFLTGRLALLRGDAAAAQGEYAKLTGMFEDLPDAVDYIDMLQAFAALRTGRGPAHAEALPREALSHQLRLGDRSAWEWLAELAVALEDEKLAQAVRTRLRTSVDQMVSGGVIAMTWDTPVARNLALVESWLGEADAALRHFEIARRRVEQMGGKPIAAQIACEQARALIRHGGDRAQAAALVERADATIRELGLDALRSLVDEARAEVAAATATATAIPAGSAIGAFALRREGDYWTVECDGAVFRLKDMKGLQILAQLVAEPGREYHALELSGVSADDAIDRGDAGELLDEHARDEYRARLRELDETIERAESWNDPGRAAAAREEREFLAAELSRAVGLGGRSRRAGAAAERARVNVQRRLTTAIKKIAEHHPALARHLERAIRTGAFCSYDPE